MSSQLIERDFIIKDPELELSLDYKALRRQGLKHIEALASDLWTDYNVHDPGITIFELLCYAITDLGYRSQQDIRDILTSTEQGEAKIKGQFHDAQTILPSAPVTFNDLRKLLIDIDGVRNAWIARHSELKFKLDVKETQLKPNQNGDISLNGVFDVMIEYESWLTQGQQSATLKQVKTALSVNRNLCEDVNEIRALKPEYIAVCADLEVHPSTDIETTLAEVFFALSEFIAPQLRFYSIEEMMAKGKTTDEIFSGPLLNHGFIDDDDLAHLTQRCFLAASDLNNVIMDVAGLIAVKGMTLLNFGSACDLVDQNGDAVQPKSRQQWILEFDSSHLTVPVLCSKLSKITFYKNGLPYFANMAVVEALLKEKLAGKRNAAKMMMNKQLHVPAGRDLKLNEYYPVQNELPKTYYAGMQKLPKSASKARQGQSKQLKAYLLFFEQLLANYFAQLSQVHELFSWQKQSEQTYFSQPISDIHEIEKLYEDYAHLTDDLENIAETPEQAKVRNNQFLDHLLARFCESFTDYSLLMYDMDRTEKATNKVMRDKQSFLANYASLSAQRGQGFDYYGSQKANSLTGFQRRVYALLGISEQTEKNLQQLSSSNIEIQQTGNADPKKQWFFVLKQNEKTVFKSVACHSRESIENILDQTLILGGDSTNYQPLAEQNQFELILPCLQDKEKTVLGSTVKGVDLQKVVNFFAEQMQQEGMHLIEHILLRPRFKSCKTMPIQLNQNTPCDCIEVKDSYSFRMTIVLPAWAGRFADMRFRQFVEQTLRLEAPAHCLMRICWINYSQMQAFESAHKDWFKQFSQLMQIQLEEPISKADQKVAEVSAEFASRYSNSLNTLIEVMSSLNSIYPIARVHDCQHRDAESSPMILNNSILGTF